MTRFNKYILTVLVLTAFLSASCGFKRKKYENPIAKDTQQPDKVLFDKAVHDIEKGHYEIARLTLNTLINTYDTSEFLAKAKLAVADSWYREGGTHGMAQAEAEYKDFILFYPAMEEAAESQKKICDIHFFQMDKADRDPNNALRAEQECKTLITQFPNSKFVPQTEQQLRQIQEVLAGAEFASGYFYYQKGSNAAADNRFRALVDQYPLYSQADLALWDAADALSKMGPRFRQQDGDTLARLVKEYPLSPYAAMAKKKLQSMEMAVPEADPTAVARMKYEQENRTKTGILRAMLDPFKGSPNVNAAAKSGSPTMTNPKQTIPLIVPVPAAQAGITDVTVAPVTDPTAIERLPDARTGGAGAADAKGEKPESGAPAAAAPAAGAPAPASTGSPAPGSPTATPATSTPGTPAASAAGKPAPASAAASTPAAQDQTSTSTKKKKEKKPKAKKDTKTSTDTSTKPAPQNQ
jgi:outer membrane protein assembly factor BamD